MDERTRELIAIGASVGVNCHPCTRYHLAKCDELGISRDEVTAAAEVGLAVNRGAARQTRAFARELLGEAVSASPAAPEAQPEGCGCGCG